MRCSISGTCYIYSLSITPCLTKLVCVCRYLVSQDHVVPVKALTDCLSKHFPQFKFAEGKGAEVKKVIDNSKVLPLLMP